jgi:transcriptional regulator with XRE-family HTH domain
MSGVDSLGALIRAERERQEMTQQSLANRLSVSLRTIGGWEHGATIPPRQIPKLERALRVRIRQTGSGDYAMSRAADPPEIEGAEAVDTTGDGGRVVIYVPAGVLEGVTDAERDEMLTAARLALLRAAREIGRHPSA